MRLQKIYMMITNGKTYLMHKQFLRMCDKVSNQSKCLSRHVGALLVRDGILLSTGFNRVPKNTKDCVKCIRANKKSGESLDICKALHAEEICILTYLKNNRYKDLKDCTLYVSLLPCYNCAKLIVESGIRQVIVGRDYNSKHTKALFKEAGVKVMIL